MAGLARASCRGERQIGTLMNLRRNFRLPVIRPEPEASRHLVERLRCRSLGDARTPTPNSVNYATGLRSSLIQSRVQMTSAMAGDSMQLDNAQSTIRIS
jgi:hypothetical protein